MGQEIDCRARLGRKTDSGRAHLESDHVLFRGTERVKIMFRDVSAVSVERGWLRLEHKGGTAAFELGSRAERWADKIVNPPSRLKKLGVSGGKRVSVLGSFDADFLDELAKADADVSKRVRKESALVFLAADDPGELERMGALKDALVPEGAVWVVYLKGRKELSENMVLEAGRAHGYKDVKVASFSPTHTALKFVIPVADRRR